MPAMDVHLVIRWLHVSAAMLIGGGAALLALLCRRPVPPAHVEAVLGIARQYEYVFWAAFGVVVAAGVGNLGAFGSGLPVADSQWGTALSIKLGLVVLVATLSVARTLVVATLDGVEVARALPLLRASYLATGGLLLGVVGLAEVLAHG